MFIKKIIIFIIILMAIGAGWRFMDRIGDSHGKLKKTSAIALAEITPPKTDHREKIIIGEKATYGRLMQTAGIDYALAMEIYEAAKPQYDLAKIRMGRFLELIYRRDTNNLKELIYKIDSEDELHVKKKRATSSPDAAGPAGLSNNFLWQAEILPIPYEVKTKIAFGKIKSSMYQAALDNNIDIRAIIKLANAFQWSVDFAMDPRVGDSFKFIYRERYLDMEYVMPGQILAGYYINDGKKYEIYYFKESKDNQGYFDEEGNSAQKMFLKAPVAYKYISSGYTTGRRYIGAFKAFTKSHMAIDYAAAIGTPVRSVGDGAISYIGWKGDYGRTIGVHHNGTYSTNYSHLNGYAVKRGQKVKQGEVIGYVGSSGFSSGPHLHYEMVKNGIKTNPLREILPPGRPIKEENREKFFKKIKKYQEMLDD